MRLTTVYHTSDREVRHPDTCHSRQWLDFGPGFYVTPLHTQAVRYGARFTIRGRSAIVNSYSMTQPDGLRLLRFEAYDEAWLEHVAACRQGHKAGDYDIIEGGVADDRVFDTIDLFFAGRMSKSDALSRLAFIHPNWQICFATQRAIDQCLRYTDSETL